MNVATPAAKPYKAAMANFTLAVDGMHCDGCVRRLRKMLEATQGVRVVDVKIGEVAVEAEALDGTRATIERAGYTVTSGA
jgi:copper chaperone CopZ